MLVLNSGSSSLKYKLFEMPGEVLRAAGRVERIGEGPGGALMVVEAPVGRCASKGCDCVDHAQALEQVLAAVYAHCQDPSIELIGHRVVHGGALFDGPTVVDDTVIDRMESLLEMAPLHMPPALAVLRACRERMPHARQVVCFDTSFHRSMPPLAHRYAVPRRWYTDHGVRRYGFHGLSHQYVVHRAAEMLDRPSAQLKLISAHLGNGASITAFDRGRVLDTSMGFTPLEGLIMGTRCGPLDPAVLLHIQRRTGMNLAAMIHLLNTQSGLQAVSGLGRDLRAILAARAEGDPDATLAVEMYVHTLRKYIGAYHFALDGAQALIFTGGIGENSAAVRALVLEGWAHLGLELDGVANAAMTAGQAGFITRSTSPIKALVIPTDEERLIARQAHAATAGGQLRGRP
ncbi:acetate kinase [Desulfatitalea alkaliphila]